MQPEPDALNFAEDMRRAPRVWWTNAAGVRIRIIDPTWARWYGKQRARLDAERTRKARGKSFETEASLTRTPVATVIREVLDLHEGLTMADLRSPRRVMRIRIARHHLAYELYRRTYMSTPQIGRLLFRDHTTIVNSVQAWPGYARKLGIPAVELHREGAR